MTDTLTDAAWRAAVRVVADRLGVAILPIDGVTPKYVGIRSRVARVRLRTAEDGEAVIVKQRFTADGPPYDAADRTPTSLATRVACEAAALQFLDGRTPHRLAPRLIGVDYGVGVLVMDDLGEGPGLLEHLLADDPTRADRALCSYATAMGELHAAGAGRADEFAAILARFGPRPTDPLIAVIAGYRTAFHQAMDSLAMTIPPAVCRYLDEAIERMRSPGAFHTLTHGDICPGHDRINDDHSAFIDLELAGYRHALYDLAYLYVPFPFCGFVGRIPANSRAQAVAAYRVAVSRDISAIADDDQFHRELAYAWTFWIIRNVGALLTEARDHDPAWGTSTFRQRLIQQFTDLGAFPYLVERCPAVAEWATHIAGTLQTLWPDTPPMPPYPAYVGSWT